MKLIDERKGKIYKIVNDINCKVYVGQTIQSLNERFANHCGRDNKNNMLIKRAINKYGKLHFLIILLEDNIDLNNLDAREKYWISFYNSYYNGYNATLGGKREGASNTHKNEVKEKVIEMYTDNYTIKQILNLYKISKGTLYKWLKVYNILNNRNNKICKEDFIQYSKLKVTFNDIAEHFNICLSTARKLYKEYIGNKVKNKRKSVTEIEQSNIIKDYTNGYNIKDLCLKYRTTKKYISKCLKQNHITIIRNKKSIRI